MSGDIRLDPTLLSRVEVFGDMHAAKVGAVDVEIQVQDDGRTLKIWLTKNADKQARYMTNLRESLFGACAHDNELDDRFARSCSHDDDLSCAGCES